MRLFIAISLPADVRTSLRDLVDRFRSRGDPFRWIDPDNVHLTLKFLGEVPGALLLPLEQAIGETASQFPPFSLVVRGIGAFPSADRPRIVWVGVVAEDVLTSLHDGIDQALRPLGFEPEERAFRPHLTIGRLRRDRKGRGGVKASLGDRLTGLRYDGGRFGVESVELMESLLKPTGAVYLVKASLPLAGAVRPA
jgi:2'-5' RNA ligase